LASITWPKNYDVVINIGNKMQHNGVNPIVARGVKFIDMRIDYQNMGKVMVTDVMLFRKPRREMSFDKYF
jgi:hypothetical protein